MQHPAVCLKLDFGPSTSSLEVLREFSFWNWNTTAAVTVMSVDGGPYNQDQQVRSLVETR